MAAEPDRRLHTEGDPVPGEWVDYNGHVLDACYLLAFAPATTALLEAVELGEGYREATGCTIYTVECHVRYLRELHAGDPLRVTFQLLDFDRKRLHTFEQLFHAEQGWVAATSENMSLHVDMAAGKTAPFPDDVASCLARMQAAHRHLPRPEAAGRRIAMR